MTSGVFSTGAVGALAPLILGQPITSGVFSTGATGAIAPVILRRKLIAPVILPGMYPPQ